jgi:hypothetical protein
MPTTRKTTRLALIAAAALAAPTMAGAVDLDGTWDLRLKCTQVGPGFPIERQKVDTMLRIAQDGETLDVELNGDQFAFGRVIADGATPTKGMLSLVGCGANVVTQAVLTLTAEAKATADGKGSFKGVMAINSQNLVSLCTAEAKRTGPGQPTSPSCAPDKQ